MERYQLKNIIIVILLLVNLFLVSSLITRNCAERENQQRMEEQLVQLFSADGIALPREILDRPAPSEPLSLSRDISRERQVASFFLGSDLTRDNQNNQVCTYRNQYGVAIFRADGSFDIAGSLSAGYNSYEDCCQKFCRKFSYDTPVFALDASLSGTASAALLYQGHPVIGSDLLFSIRNKSLQSVSGTLLSESAVPVSAEEPPLSAAAALTTFLQFRRESGVVVSSVTDLSLCYELQSTIGTPVLLSPCWQVATDTVPYYVNAITGLVRTE